MDDLLPILLILFGLWWLWRQTILSARRPSENPEPTEILPCARCGTYVPRTEATTVAGKVYCCPEHGIKKTR